MYPKQGIITKIINSYKHQHYQQCDAPWALYCRLFYLTQMNTHNTHILFDYILNILIIIIINLTQLYIYIGVNVNLRSHLLISSDTTVNSICYKFCIIALLKTDMLPE